MLTCFCPARFYISVPSFQVQKTKQKNQSMDFSYREIKNNDGILSNRLKDLKCFGAFEEALNICRRDTATVTVTILPNWSYHKWGQDRDCLAFIHGLEEGFVFFKLSNQFCDRYECSFFLSSKWWRTMSLLFNSHGWRRLFGLQAKGRFGALGECKLLSIDVACKEANAMTMQRQMSSGSKQDMEHMS